MLHTERQQLVGIGGNQVGLATPLVQGAGMRQGGSQAIWTRAFPSPRERRCDARHSLVWIAKEPQDPGRRVSAKTCDRSGVSVEHASACSRWRTGRREGPEMEEDTSQPLVRLHEPARVVHPLGVGEELLRHLTGGL